MKTANFGTVCHGTLRTEDLLADFASELEYHVRNNAEAWCSDGGRKERDALMSLIGEAREIDPDDEFADEMVDDLEDALQRFAPAYAYFGVHPGDGCDFGFWPFDTDEIKEQVTDCGGIVVSDTSEVPADFTGEVLHINEHGNATLYSATDGELTEVWSLA